MRKSNSYSIHNDTEMTKKNRRRQLVTEKEIEAALQLIELKNCHQSLITCDQHIGFQIPEPFMKIVLKSKEFLQARSIYHDNDKDNDGNNICEDGYENIGKRKSDGIASCSSSVTFDVDDSSDKDGNEVVGSVKKMKKYRSIVDIYNVSTPL